MRHTIIRKLQRACMLLCGLGLAAGVQAHHSAAQFDFAQNVEITGKIIHIDVSNPHIDLVLEQPAADGSTKQVQYEGHSRNNVFRRGWRPDMMSEGDSVTIFIAPMRNGEDGGYIQSFKLQDGRTF
jgi:hypothetical protein